MIPEPTVNPVKRHDGKNVQKVRVYLGIKQDALASELGITQQTVSSIEQQEEIEDEQLNKIAEALGVSADTLKNFDEEKAIYNINNNYEILRLQRVRLRLFSNLIRLKKSLSYMKDY